MRQSGTVALALVVAWLLVLAEGRGRERSDPVAAMNHLAKLAKAARPE